MVASSDGDKDEGYPKKLGTLHRLKEFDILDDRARDGVDMERYLDGFSSAEDVIGSFKAPSDALNDAVVIAAIYTQESYEGSAMGCLPQRR